MHIIKLSALAATVLLATPFATAADMNYGQTGQGWDVFKSHTEGRQMLSTTAFIGTSMAVPVHGGYDISRNGYGVPIVINYQSTESSGRGFDLFRVGEDTPY